MGPEMEDYPGLSGWAHVFHYKDCFGLRLELEGHTTSEEWSKKGEVAGFGD